MTTTLPPNIDKNEKSNSRISREEKATDLSNLSQHCIRVRVRLGCVWARRRRRRRRKKRHRGVRIQGKA